MPKRSDISKVLIIGSGPIIIGQACEFDYSGTQACKALRKLGYEIVLVNSNPATIMTDPGMADVTYIEPLNLQSLTEIIDNERPDAILPNLGGQTGLNLTSELHKTGVLEKYGVRDAKNKMITVCFIENVDAMGVHTGDSYCTAPMLTISPELQARFQKHSYDIVEAIEVIGGTNIGLANTTTPTSGRRPLNTKSPISRP